MEERAMTMTEMLNHCDDCGAMATGYHEETNEWTCDRCGAAKDHERLATWFLKNCADEIREGGLSDNVIRLLSQPS